MIAKVFEIADEASEARVEHEFRLLHALDLEGVVSALGLERAGRQLVLLLEYVPGCNLAEDAHGQPLALDRFLPRALSMAEILTRIHARRVIHRDIKPTNILIDSTRDAIVFADFGISVLIEDEQRRLYDRDVIEGTLPYVSPEQTGRTRREVDFRSDLYSLGVTFYELLTGARPFEADAPHELIHAHLALRPVPPRSRNPALPEQLSQIVMKLLEKAPEHRYQSAAGLHADLQRLAEQLAAGVAAPSFPLGEADRPLQLALPHHLYGRARELEALDQALAGVRAAKRRDLVVLRGGSGVGKTALLHGLDVPLSACAGYLGLGRFEAHAREPDHALVRALQAVLEQILSESDERLAGWRARLREALGSIAGALIDRLPELALIIGPTPLVPELEPSASRNRLELAFSRLLGGLAGGSPLVLALDDLHHADATSLALIEALVREGSGPVLLVATLDDEHEPTSEAREAIDRAIAELERERIARTIHIGELDDASLVALLADTLGRGSASEDGPRAAALTELAGYVARKTAKRPSFIGPLLEHLAELGLLQPAARGWTWDIETIGHAAIPGDLLGVLTTKLTRLPTRERALLARAACFGERFTPSSLALVDGEPLTAELLALEHAGLIDPIGPDYRFAHARLRTSVLELLDPHERLRLHWQLGRRRLAQIGGVEALFERPDELLFEIVEQLEIGAASPEALADTPARRELARLAAQAGKRALRGGAWATAIHAYQLALAQPEPEPTPTPDDDRGQARFEARVGLASALGFAGRSAEADAAFDQLLAEPLALTDHAMLVARRSRALVATGETGRALELVRASIEAHGLDIPAKPSTPQLILALVRAWRPVLALDRERLLALPEVRDERVRAAMHMLVAAEASAFSVDQQLFVYLVAVHARLIARHGYHETAIDALSAFSFALVAMGKVPEANRLIDDVIALGQARDHPTALPGALGIRSMFVGPSQLPFHACAAPMELNHRHALELGDRVGAGLQAAIALVLHLEACTHLAELRALFERLHAVHETWVSPEFAAIAGIAMQVHARLSTAAPTRSRGQAPVGEPPPSSAPSVEPPPPPQPDAPGISALTRCAAVVSAVWVDVLLGDHEAAWARAETIATTWERAMFGSWVIPRFAALDAVLVGERARARRGLARLRLVRRLRRDLAILRRWAALGPDNFQPLADIAQAELAWLRGHASEAARLYEHARTHASAQGRAWVEALACLRLAALAADQGWVTLREGALRGAHRAFERWGAWAAVERLEHGHAVLVEPVKLDETQGSSPRSRAVSTSERGVSLLRSTSLTGHADLISLDLAAVLGTVQMIGEDLRLEEVITRVLGSAITNAGADRGLLLLEREGELALVAEGRDAQPSAFLDHPIPLAAAGEQLPSAALNLVARTGVPLVIDDLAQSRFAGDPYVARSGVRSLLCMPLVKQGVRIGVLVLENRLHARAFTDERLETSRILMAQAASAIDNARLYAELARSETQWRSLVDGAPDVITLLDERGRVEFINHLGPLQADASAQIGQPGDALLDPESASRWRGALLEVLAGDEVRELEVAFAVAGGRRWAMVRLARLPSEGPRRRVLSIATDITERKGLELQLREQQRLEAIGTLAAGVAHEINNPVQGILNYAELIHEHALDPETVREFSLEITTESQRVAAIVRNLLAFARHDRHPSDEPSGESSREGFEEVEVRPLIEATLSLVRAVMRKDQIHVELEVPAELPRLRCRPQPIQQILMNLITNARDALNERYAGFDERKRVTIGVEPFGDGSCLRIRVADLAGGIPEAIRSRIFDPFFTTKGRDKGTGLGLSVSHGIAREHGGDLRVESELGVGSRFLLELPIAGPSPEP